ncbi:MAG: cytochrome c oxidase subunit 3 [Bacteroidota bacterium]
MAIDKVSKNIEAQLMAEEPQPTLSMNPKKFMLWLFIVSVVMIFAAWTSAYLVRQAEGNWLEFEMPSIFWFNSAVLLASSIFMHWAYISAKRDNLVTMKVTIALTFVLGMTFLVGQWIGWAELVNINVYFGGKSSNPAGSFMYVLTGVHALHLISGVIVLLFAVVAAFRFRIHSKSMVQIEMCATYWHFLDALWLYLFVFLLVNHS